MGEGKMGEGVELNEEDANPEPIEGRVNILEPQHGPSGDSAPFYHLEDVFLELLLNIPELMNPVSLDLNSANFRQIAPIIELEQHEFYTPEVKEYSNNLHH